MDTDAWEQAGLFDPDAPGADERRALLEYLTERGATIAPMSEAHRLGGLPGVAGDLVMGPTTAPIPVEEVAAHLGVPVERVLRVLLSVGLPVTADNELPHHLDRLMSAFEQGTVPMGEDAILAFTRVPGGRLSEYRRGGDRPLLCRAGSRDRARRWK